MPTDQTTRRGMAPVRFIKMRRHRDSLLRAACQTRRRCMYCGCQVARVTARIEGRRYLRFYCLGHAGLLARDETSGGR